MGRSFSVGRVQTPTLAMLVDRELSIRSFVPENYKEITATFHPVDTAKENQYEGTWFRRPPEGTAAPETLQKATRLPADGAEAKQIAARARTGEAYIHSVERENTAHSSASVLRPDRIAASRKTASSASRPKKTLDLAQALYERYKTHQLSAHGQPLSVAGRGAHAARCCACGLACHGRALSQASDTWHRRAPSQTAALSTMPRWTDHHAIIPTAASPGKSTTTARGGQDLRPYLPPAFSAPGKRIICLR